MRGSEYPYDHLDDHFALERAQPQPNPAAERRQLLADLNPFTVRGSIGELRMSSRPFPLPEEWQRAFRLDREGLVMWASGRHVKLSVTSQQVSGLHPMPVLWQPDKFGDRVPLAPLSTRASRMTYGLTVPVDEDSFELIVGLPE